MMLQDPVDVGGGLWGCGVHGNEPLNSLVGHDVCFSGSLRVGAFLFVPVGEIPLTVQLHTKKLHVDPNRLLFPERDGGMAHHFALPTFPKPRTKGACVP